MERVVRDPGCPGRWWDHIHGSVQKIRGCGAQSWGLVVNLDSMILEVFSSPNSLVDPRFGMEMQSPTPILIIIWDFFLGEHWEAAPQFSWLDSAKDHTLCSGSGREQRLQPGISHCFRGMLDSLSSGWDGAFACLQTEFFPVGFDLQIPGPSGPGL